MRGNNACVKAHVVVWPVRLARGWATCEDQAMQDRPEASGPTPLPRVSLPLAAVLTFLAAACVLVLEIAAARLLAPYVGVTLTTYTAIIGVILAGISLGAWLGGRAADARPPERLIGPTLALGGLASMASVPLVALLGEDLTGGGVFASLVLAAVGFVAPATVLSAISPMLVRATIRDVATSGRLVGRLSAIGTAGAIIGTFLTGFVLLGAIPTRYLIVGTGGLLVLVGLVLMLRFNRSPMGIATLLLAAAGASLVAVDAESPCERESPYYCVTVREEGADPSRRRLFLDNLLHAFVDVDDPTETRLTYIRWFAAASDDLLARPSSGAGAGSGLDAVHIGGGGFAFPRYLRAVDPGSQHVVLELDPVVLDVARRELGFVHDPAIEVRLGDARGTLRDVADDGADLVVGDAFGGLSVPWHLTTREFVADIDRVLRPDGRYIANLIDGPNLRLVRAEVATLMEQFQHLAVVTRRAVGLVTGDSNIVVVASHAPIDVTGLQARAQAADAGTTVIGGTDVAAFAAGALPLWDDFAPTDQLLGR